MARQEALVEAYSHWGWESIRGAMAPFRLANGHATDRPQRAPGQGHSQVKQATFHAADHELKVTLTDGVTRTVVYPVEYDDELAALLMSKSVAVMAENPNFFQENKGIFLFVGGVLLITIMPMVAFGVKSRFIARSKRVSDVPAERFSDVLDEGAHLRAVSARPAVAQQRLLRHSLFRRS